MENEARGKTRPEGKRGPRSQARRKTRPSKLSTFIHLLSKLTPLFSALGFFGGLLFLGSTFFWGLLFLVLVYFFLLNARSPHILSPIVPTVG